MRTITRRRVLLAAAGLLPAAIVGRAAGAQTAGAIESAFAAQGPWTVAEGTSGGHSLFYPADLGAGGLRHPIVTWGNGSFATPDDYVGMLNHLASWGFAVVASTDSTTGTGAEILDAAQHLVSLDTQAGSVFHGKLDVTEVAAVGHSQGAGGSINASTLSGGLITTVVPIALPAPIWVGAGDAFCVGALPCPVLFLSGANDWLISPASALQDYYDEVPGAAGKALLLGAGHNDVQDSGGGFLGYVTAWLMYQLCGDAQARAAFAGGTPELLTNAAWQHQAVKNLT